MANRLTFRAADQLINSASSAIFSIGLVVVTDNAELGAIAIQMTALPVLLGLSRTSVYESVLFRVTGDQRSQATWVPIATGLVGGLLGLVVSLALGGVVGLGGRDSLAIAAVTGLVLLFDGLRFGAIVAGLDVTAMRADIAWLALTTASVVATANQTNLTATRLAWCYGGAALVASFGFWGLVRSIRIVQLPSGLLKEFRFGADFVLQVAPGQIALAAAALVTSLDAIGSLRAAVTLFSPLATLVYAVRLTMIDRMESVWRMSPNAAYAALAAAYGIALTVTFGAFADLAAQLFGPLPMLVLAAVSIGELARHLTQAQVDRARESDRLQSAVNIRSIQALLLIIASVALAPPFADDGLAIARVIAFGGPLLALRAKRFRGSTT